MENDNFTTQGTETVFDPEASQEAIRLMAEEELNVLARRRSAAWRGVEMAWAAVKREADWIQRKGAKA